MSRLIPTPGGNMWIESWQSDIHYTTTVVDGVEVHQLSIPADVFKHAPRIVQVHDSIVVEPKSYDAAAREIIEQKLQLIDKLWSAKIGTPEGDELDKLIDEVEALEEKHAIE